MEMNCFISGVMQIDIRFGEVNLQLDRSFACPHASFEASSPSLELSV